LRREGVREAHARQGNKGHKKDKAEAPRRSRHAETIPECPALPPRPDAQMTTTQEIREREPAREAESRWGSSIAQQFGSTFKNLHSQIEILRSLIRGIDHAEDPLHRPENPAARTC